MKVVIIEDDFKLANLYKGKLEEEGFGVEIFSDVEAVSKVKSSKPDLVILDLIMPKVSGLSILRELRADWELETLPVLIMTNVEGTEEMEQAIKLGVDGYLLKSEVDLDTLVNRVKTLLESRKK